jgi:hypothetical protein
MCIASEAPSPIPERWLWTCLLSHVSRGAAPPAEWGCGARLAMVWPLRLLAQH